MKLLLLTITILFTTTLLGATNFLPDDWAHGTYGYEAARKEAMTNGIPMLVYFYAPWCPYSAQLNRQLNNPDVRQYIQSIPKVAINGGERHRDRALGKLMTKYKVSGFPTIFVVYTSGKRRDLERYQGTYSTKFMKIMRYTLGTANREKAVKLYRRAKKRGTQFKPWKLKRPELIEEKNKAAFTEIKHKNYEKGLELLWESVRQDATNGDGWYGLGHCYFKLADQQKGESRLSFLKDAKRYYRSALKFKVAKRKALLDELYEVNHLLKLIQTTANAKSE